MSASDLVELAYRETVEKLVACGYAEAEVEDALQGYIIGRRVAKLFKSNKLDSPKLQTGFQSGVRAALPNNVYVGEDILDIDTSSGELGEMTPEAEKILLRLLLGKYGRLPR